MVAQQYECTECLKTCTQKWLELFILQNAYFTTQKKILKVARETYKWKRLGWQISS